MDESIFIKTVLYGGYDKDDVIKKINELNLQIAEANNRLSEMKIQLDACKKGQTVESAYETALSTERAELSQIQAQNETYEAIISGYKDEISKKNAEIDSLKTVNNSLNEELSDAKAKLAAAQSEDEGTALSLVFVEAQKSAKSLKGTATAEAEKIKSEASKIAEDTVTEANNKAARIVYEAEKKAATTMANAKNDAEQMKVADNNMKASMLEDVNTLHIKITNMKSTLEAFGKNGMAELRKIAEVIDYTENMLKSGGVPKYQQPKTYNAEIPEEPKQEKTSRDNEKSKNSGLDKLQKMADALGGGSSSGKAKSNKSLDDLKKMADSIGGEPKGNKGGGMSLDALKKQADSL